MLAFGVTQILFIGTMPNTSVQAELQMPSMMTRSAVADARVLGLVFLDIAAMIARDVQIGARAGALARQSDQQGERRDAHGSNRSSVTPEDTGVPVLQPDQASKLWRDCVDFVKHRETGQKLAPCD